jgi:hypothetical protein
VLIRVVLGLVVMIFSGLMQTVWNHVMLILVNLSFVMLSVAMLSVLSAVLILMLLLRAVRLLSVFFCCVR